MIKYCIHKEYHLGIKMTLPVCRSISIAAATHLDLERRRGTHVQTEEEEKGQCDQILKS